MNCKAANYAAQSPMLDASKLAVSGGLFRPSGYLIELLDAVNQQ